MARGGSKTRHERMSRPTFDVLIELQGHREFLVYPNIGEAVDALLSGRKPQTERRFFSQGHWHATRTVDRPLHSNNEEEEWFDLLRQACATMADNYAS